MATAHGFAHDNDIVGAIGRSWGWVLAFGLVTLALGIVVAIHPKNSVYVIAVILAIWLLIAGVFRIVSAVADREDSGGTRTLRALLGLVSILFGLLIFHRTWETVAVVGFILGLFWVVSGVGELYSAYVLPSGAGRVLLIISGIVAVIVGVLALVYPGLSLTIIAFLFGLWLILFGLVEIAVSLQVRSVLKES
jgi:uncharacterized membrane protein HdeD (DUF308 family)